MFFNKRNVDERQGECSLTREMLMNSMGKALLTREMLMKSMRENSLIKMGDVDEMHKVCS